MFRPFIRVARPDDWTGLLARSAVGVVALVLTLAALLGTLPPAWVQMVDGRPWVVRVGLLLGVAWFSVWIRALSYALLPRAPVLFGRRLFVWFHGRRIVVHVGSVVDAAIERRPDPVREVFVLELRDGRRLDLCPVHWSGAARLYRSLVRKLGRARRRA